MRFNKGDRVEVAGDPHEEGWEDSWWTAVVIKPQSKGHVTIRYDEMLEEDGKSRLVESVPLERLRPACEDDSVTLPLERRQPGDAVDCWHEDGWWEGHIHRVFDDRITVFFPRTAEEYSDIYPPKKPMPDPEAHRVRTGKDWDLTSHAWRARPKKAYPGAGNFRSSSLEAPSAAAQAATAAAPRQQQQQQQQLVDSRLAPGPARAAGQQPQAAAAADSSTSGEDVPLSIRLATLRHKLTGGAPTQSLPPQPTQQQQQQAIPVAATSQQAQTATPPVSAAASVLPTAKATVAAQAGIPSAAAPAVPKAAAQQTEAACLPAALQEIVCLVSEGEDAQEVEEAADEEEEDAGEDGEQEKGEEEEEARFESCEESEVAEGSEEGSDESAVEKPPVELASTLPGTAAPAGTTAAGCPSLPTRTQATAAACPDPAAASVAMHAAEAVATTTWSEQAVPNQAAGRHAAAQPTQAQLGLQPPAAGSNKKAEKPLIAQELSFREAPAAQQQQQNKQDVQQQQKDQQRQKQAPIVKRNAPIVGGAASAAQAERRSQAAVLPKGKDTGRQQGSSWQRLGSLRDRPAASKAPASGGGNLFVIPKRLDSGKGSGAPESPRGALPSPRQAAAAVADALLPDRKRRRLAGQAEAAAAIPRVQRQQQQQQQEEEGDASGATTALCLDNLPASVSSVALEAALRGLGFNGLQSVKVASVPLDAGDRMCGYAVLRFTSPQRAAKQMERLRSLCILSPTCPVARPLIVHEPRILGAEYGWGMEARLPGHLPFDFTATQHFSQPNSIEFDLALDWRRLLGVLAAAKQALCREQAIELSRLLARHLTAGGQEEPQLQLQRMMLPGDDESAFTGHEPSPLELGRRHHFRSAAADGAAAGAKAAGPPTACVWLSGVPVGLGEQALIEAFGQFGFPQQAYLVPDPVTGRPSSHAVLWVESEQRARDLVANLQEMVYVLNATPRAVDARLAVPGPPLGSQSTYDRALRCVLGTDDTRLEGEIRFVEVPDERLLDEEITAEEQATIALRRLLRSHSKEQDELEREKVKRLWELDARHRRQLDDKRYKLGRLAQMQLAAGPEGKPLLQHLMEQHGVRGHFYGIVKKDTIRHAQMAAAEKRRREAEHCAGGRAAAAAPHRGRSPPGAW